MDQGLSGSESLFTRYFYAYKPTNGRFLGALSVLPTLVTSRCVFDKPIILLTRIFFDRYTIKRQTVYLSECYRDKAVFYSVTSSGAAYDPSLNTIQREGALIYFLNLNTKFWWSYGVVLSTV